MDKRIIKAKGLCPFGCCSNGTTKHQQNRTVRRQTKRQWMKEYTRGES